ncbi:MAG: hypothetical protein R2825_27470 [Saprospiraceae bacterium]
MNKKRITSLTHFPHRSLRKVCFGAGRMAADAADFTDKDLKSLKLNTLISMSKTKTKTKPIIPTEDIYWVDYFVVVRQSFNHVTSSARAWTTANRPFPAPPPTVFM